MHGKLSSLSSYLISLGTADSIIIASHDRVDADMAIKRSGRQNSWVPGAPLDVEAPLRGWELIQDLVKTITPKKVINPSTNHTK